MAVERTSVGFFNPPTGFGHMVSYSYLKFIEIISALPGVDVVESTDDADIAVCMFNHWTDKYNDIELHDFGDTKVISHLFDCRDIYRGRRLVQLIKKADAVWCGGERLETMKTKSPEVFRKYVPNGTYPMEKKEKIHDMKVTMTRAYNKNDFSRCDILKKAAEEWYPNTEFHICSPLSHWEPLLNHPQMNFIREQGMESFENSKFNFEVTSTPQKMVGLEYAYWSDRQTLCTSNFCHVVTDYSPTLDQWDSAIPHGEPLEYDINALESDIKKWDWSPILADALKETLSSI